MTSRRESIDIEELENAMADEVRYRTHIHRKPSALALDPDLYNLYHKEGRQHRYNGFDPENPLTLRFMGIPVYAQRGVRIRVYDTPTHLFEFDVPGRQLSERQKEAY